MTNPVQYITNDQGDRVGVLLDLATFERLTDRSPADAEYLSNLSPAELQALADMSIAPTAKNRLDELLAQNTENTLADDEIKELEQLLEQVDSLTILKTRARYTLSLGKERLLVD